MVLFVSFRMDVGDANKLVFRMTRNVKRVFSLVFVQVEVLMKGERNVFEHR